MPDFSFKMHQLQFQRFPADPTAGFGEEEGKREAREEGGYGKETADKGKGKENRYEEKDRGSV